MLGNRSSLSCYPARIEQAGTSISPWSSSVDQGNVSSKLLSRHLWDTAHTDQGHEAFRPVSAIQRLISKPDVGPPKWAGQRQSEARGPYAFDQAGCLHSYNRAEYACRSWWFQCFCGPTEFVWFVCRCPKRVDDSRSCAATCVH